MPDEPNPYSRLYHRFITEYPDVYADKPLFGAWASLLMIADGSFPSPAPLPRWVTDAEVDRLVEAGLLTVMPGDTFSIRGLPAERARRAGAAVLGGVSRATAAERGPDGRFLPAGDQPGPAGEPAGVQPGQPAGTSRSSLDEDEKKTRTKRNEDEHPNARVGPDGWVEVIRAAESLTGRPYVVPSPHTRMGEQVVDLIERHGAATIIATFDRVAGALDKPPTIQQLVFGTRDALDRVPRVNPESEHDRTVRELKERARGNQRPD